MTDTPEMYIFHPAASDNGKRLDIFVAEQLADWSRSRIKRLIDDGDITVNERPVKPSYRVREHESVEADLSEPIESRFEAENIPLEIVFEDEHLMVINKPAGMIVHPGAGVMSGTLANAIAWHFQSHSPPLEAGTESVEIGDSQAAIRNRVGIVHRLDKDTSGLIVVARNETTHDALSKQFQDRKVFKSYVALVHGSTRENSGTIDRPIARDRFHRTKMAVSADGRTAITHWKVRERFEKFTLLDVEIKTGRTHQIRVHLASINHPVVGDSTYNEGRDKTIARPEIKKAVEMLNRFFLHAERLSFDHPSTGERLDFAIHMPSELEGLLEKIRSTI